MYQLTIGFNSVDELTTFLTAMRSGHGRVVEVISPAPNVEDTLNVRTVHPTKHVNRLNTQKEKMLNLDEIAVNNGKSWLSMDDAKVVELYTAGSSLYEIASELKRTYYSVSLRIQWLRGQGRLGYRGKKLSKRIFQPGTTIHIASDGVHTS